MSKTLAELRKSRGSFEKIQKDIESVGKKSNNNKDNDDRFWSAKLDDSKNGSAIIRFLPAMGNDELPYVRQFSHGFKVKETGRWYIELCRTTIGEDDPVVDACNDLWKTGVKANQDLVRERKRRLSFISNVYIVSDPANPENEGKVFLFKYGKTIFDILMASMKPEKEFEDDEDVEPVDPFDIDNGANFRLKIYEKDGYAKMDKSKMAKPSPLADSDEEMEAILKQCYSLSELNSPDKFKSYDDLQSKLDWALGLKTGKKKADLDDDDEEFIKSSKKPAKKVEEDDDDEPAPPPKKPSKKTDDDFDDVEYTPKKKVEAKVDEDETTEDDLDYFRNLANS